ncbi:hypothetical protein GGS23DRAFT_450369 [Durotheca rogersii]|uniref:uncharacterized protein n=1 Tax=Durotheca rogersii TaxID=419775 RepID=UPI00221FAADD|nr:uncharacterized protein GGS23DRAFT_450369 [Durotheca rogersii]KAI5864516.1 hypothetical protein GGS23DRAFT_450369 [Durotheca rogersii]
MSGDEPISSFGDPNAQPPTPKQTPTSAGFPSSVFETPKNNHHHRASFDESSGWTPRFAEEYSVFNSTPGNLTGSHPPFVDFSVPTPYQSSHHKRPLSAEEIAADIASHVTHYLPNPNLPLPAVEPSRRLLSSPAPLVTDHSPTETSFQTALQQLSSKKGYRDTPQEAKTQTATPPPSAHKGKRRLAPKLQTGIMQNEGFDPELVPGTPQQQHMSGFISAPDLFGYPMSAPATAPAFGDARIFWDSDMTPMDIDFSTASGSAFPPPSHRPMGSLDWGKSNEVFQDTGVVPSQTQETGHPPAKKERALAPKPVSSPLDTSAADSSMFSSSFPASADDSFVMMSHSGGVDPGLLFTRPPSADMEPAPFDPMPQPTLMQPLTPLETAPVPAKQPKRGPVRRTAGSKGATTGKKANRASASSPVKPIDRPGLSRSVSEKGTRKPAGKMPSLPSLAPAARPIPQSTRRSVSQGPRTGGRISPLKNYHHRLPSLSSIPEAPAPRTQTSVKFTIDSKGRARAETTTIVVNDEEPTSAIARRRREEQRGQEQRWTSSGEDESSTDDEPIIIPSRNTSFAAPDLRMPSSQAFHTSQTSIADQSTSSLGIYFTDHDPADNDAESEAETVMNVADGGDRGDAASELRKVIESRQKRGLNTGEHFGSRPAYSASSTVSPVSLRTSELHTPSADRSYQIRCICNTASSHINGNGYMVQCESCEMWLHGKCTNITRQTHPRVYVCAFCANTPNAHGMRGREIRRTTGGSNPRLPITSPLAHRSFKSFR